MGPTTDRSSPGDLEAVFASEYARGHRLARFLTGDTHRADDVVAEAFARMYPHWRNGKVDDPGAYLRRIIVNEVNSEWRRLRRERAQAAAADAVGDATDRVSDADRLERALATLPTRMRAAVVLRHLEDQSEADTAATLGISIGSVKSAVSRGLEKLRVALEDET